MIEGEATGTSMTLRRRIPVACIVPIIILAFCWSWIGLANVVIPLALSSDVLSGDLASLIALLLNIIALAVSATVRLISHKRLVLNPRIIALVLPALVLSCVLAQQAFPSSATFGVTFILAICASSFAAMSCLCMAIERLSATKDSPVTELAVSFALSALINAFISGLSVQVRPFVWLLLACLAVCGAIILIDAASLEATSQEAKEDRRPSSDASIMSLIKPAMGSFLYGVAFMGMWFVSIGRSDAPGRGEATVIQSLGICLFFVLLIALNRISARRGCALFASSLQRLIFAAYVIGTMLYSLVLQTSPALSTLLVMSATALFEMTLFLWSTNWGRSARGGASMCLAVLLDSLFMGQLLTWWLLGGPAHDLLETIDPMLVGYACLVLLLPAALAVFIPLDINGGALGAHVSQADLAKESALDVPSEPSAEAPENIFAESFARRFGLSPRESEVAKLLIEGRSLPYIQQALSISEGTAKTHLRHIYEKCGAHNRQDFLSLARDEAQSVEDSR